MPKSENEKRRKKTSLATVLLTRVKVHRLHRAVCMIDSAMLQSTTTTSIPLKVIRSKSKYLDGHGEGEERRPRHQQRVRTESPPTKPVHRVSRATSKMHSPPSYIGLARAAHSMTLFSRIHAASSSIINFEQKPLAFAHLLYSSGPELKKIKWGKKSLPKYTLQLCFQSE